MVVYLDVPNDRPALTDVIRDGFRQAEEYWNFSLGRYQYRGCMDLRVDLRPRFASRTNLPAEQPGHWVELSGSRDIFGRHHDGRWLPGVVFATDGPRGDRPDAYTGDQDMTAFLPPWVFEDRFVLAHEVGHLLGLDDDREPGEQAALPGREGTMMAGWPEGADLVDEALNTRLGDLIAAAGYELPPGCRTEMWEGTLSLDSQMQGAVAVVSARWQGTFEITVEQNDQARGAGTIRLVSGPSGWPLVGGPSARDFPFAVEGRRTGATFQLKFHITGPGKERGVDYTAVSGTFFRAPNWSNEITAPGPITETGNSTRAEGSVTMRCKISCRSQ
jgi:hypothetical protein